MTSRRIRQAVVAVLMGAALPAPWAVTTPSSSGGTGAPVALAARGVPVLLLG